MKKTTISMLGFAVLLLAPSFALAQKDLPVPVPIPNVSASQMLTDLPVPVPIPNVSAS